MTTQNTTEVKFFDLVTNASGYPRRARTIPVQRGSGYERVDMGARFGRAGDLSYVNYDLKVSGDKASEDYLKIKEAINSEKDEVVWSVTIGDAYPEPFVYKKGKREGQTGVTMQGRLLAIRWASVNGELVVDNRENVDQEPDAQPENQEANLAEAS